MKLSGQIETLVAVQGDALRLATVEIDFARGDWPDAERAPLRETLVLASIPHWFDDAVLSALAGRDRSAPSLGRELETMRCVERFVGRGPTAFNVNQTTRFAIRGALAEAQPERLAALSARAAAHFASDASLAGQVEHLYHLIVADPERGAAACSARCDRWAIDKPPEYQRALVLALDELLGSGLLQGRARGAALLLVLTERLERGDGTNLRASADEVRSLLQGSPEPLDVVRAADLQGQVALVQGKPAEAVRFFNDSLNRLEALVQEAPADTSRLYLLGVAHTRLGDVEQWTEPQSALEHFSRAVEAFGQLVAAEPENTAVQRERAVTLARRGDILQKLPGRVAEASTEQQRALAMIRALVEADPTNTSRRRDLAVQLQRIGDIAVSEGRLPEALETHEMAVRITRELVASDAARLSWQGVLASLLCTVGRDMVRLERLDAAALALEEAASLYFQLTELQPTWSDWQQGLRSSLFELGSLSQRQQRLDTALVQFESYRDATLAALQARPGDLDVQRDRAIASNHIGQIRAEMGQAVAAAQDYAEAVRIMEAVSAEQPDHSGWQQDLVNLRSWLPNA